MKLPPNLTAREQWAMFQQILTTQGADSRSLALARLAFYAGMEGAMRINYAIGQDNVSEAQGVEVMKQLQHELHEFGMRLQATLGTVAGSGH